MVNLLNIAVDKAVSPKVHSIDVMECSVISQDLPQQMPSCQKRAFVPGKVSVKVGGILKTETA